MKFGGLPTKAFDLIFEYINIVDMSHKEILQLRLVNRSFDEEMYEQIQRKTGQVDEMKFQLAEQKDAFVPEGREIEFLKKENSILDRINETYEASNKTKATVEFSCYAQPPDFIYRIAEMILELTGQIPLRTPYENSPSDATPASRAEMWEKLR